MKAGNRTVAEKISIMQATAVTILSAVAETDTNGLSHHSPTSSLQEVGGSTMSSQDGTKTQIKPSLTVRHISEEENGSALARKEKASSLSAPSPNGNNQNNSNASMPAPEKNMESHCSTTSPFRLNSLRPVTSTEILLTLLHPYLPQALLAFRRQPQRMRKTV